MYKELHKEENSPYLELLPTKGSFFGCVPERGIMLTNFVYDIQLKKRKHPPVWMFFLISLLQFLFC
ncbi:hypothetical protein DMN50_01995 [Priestia megaterium]|nr:hypothetical protein [Priestia megaterium]MDR4217371.1 hypothetical protein [Priestia megaterium]RBN43017.1 hypothetical protein DMN50_01995 [Priestia megaterium]